MFQQKIIKNEQISLEILFLSFIIYLVTKKGKTMEHILENIKKLNLIKRGDTIGVAVSGGRDSMALLHYLSSLQNELDFEVVAIHIDHSLRETSGDDAMFVMSYCRRNHIRAYKFKIDVATLAKQKNQSIETAAREARYGVFESLVKKGIVDKIALAHHAEDQAETILLHLLRGSGLSGARGMEYEKRGIYIRPMLETKRSEIQRYINDNDIAFVEDETNKEDVYQRNYIRNKVMPLIVSRFPNAVEALNSFANACKEDDNFISSQVMTEALILENPKTVKIPCACFLGAPSLSSRLVFKALDMIGIYKDIERKHIEIIKNLAINGQNGAKVKLPMDVLAHKEYDYITLTNEQKEVKILNLEFKCGTFMIDGFGKLVVKKTNNPQISENNLIIDAKKLPKNVAWRFRREGDEITKFGGGTQKLKTYLSQKKIPLRQRDTIPVLASDSEIYVVAGVGISDKVRIDETTKQAYKIEQK